MIRIVFRAVYISIHLILSIKLQLGLLTLLIECRKNQANGYRKWIDTVVTHSLRYPADSQELEEIPADSEKTSYEIRLAYIDQYRQRPEAFQRLSVRASITCYRDFTLAKCRSLGFASATADLNALFRLAFTAARDVLILNLAGDGNS